MNIKLKQANNCRRDTYKVNYKGHEYEVIIIYIEGEVENTIHAQFYLMEYANAMFFFEIDLEGDLLNEDDCIEIGYGLIERNFIEFMESLGYIIGSENESESEL